MQDDQRSALGKFSIRRKGILIVVSMYGLRLHTVMAGTGAMTWVRFLLFLFSFFLIAVRETSRCLPNLKFCTGLSLACETRETAAGWFVNFL